MSYQALGGVPAFGTKLSSFIPGAGGCMARFGGKLRHGRGSCGSIEDNA
jgi:hypothetical protein